MIKADNGLVTLKGSMVEITADIIMIMKGATASLVSEGINENAAVKTLKTIAGLSVEHYKDDDPGVLFKAVQEYLESADHEPEKQETPQQQEPEFDDPKLKTLLDAIDETVDRVMDKIWKEEE